MSQSPTPIASDVSKESNTIDRRALLIAGGVAAAGAAGIGLARRWMLPKAATFIAANQTYDGRLVQTIRDGLVATGLDLNWLRGRRVLLKPNLVEPTRAAHRT